MDDAGLDEDQEKRLQQEFARVYQLVTREERLERISQDIVEHFTGRGYRVPGLAPAEGRAYRICDASQAPAQGTARTPQEAGK